MWVVFVVAGFYGAAGYFASKEAIGDHPEWRRMIAQPSDFGLTGEVVEFRSRDSVLIKASLIACQESAKATVILSHGQGGNRSHMLSRAAFLVKHGYNALVLDLRDHGESAGDYMTPGYIEALDVLGAVNYLLQKGEKLPVILLGYSYGAVASLHAAARSKDIAAVIADAAFISYSDMMDRVAEYVMNDTSSSVGSKIGMGLYRFPFVVHAANLAFETQTGVSVRPEQADAIASVPEVLQPVLFIAGEEDAIAPPQNTRLMYQKAVNPKKVLVVLPGATHSTYGKAKQEYQTAVLKFLDSVLSDAIQNDTRR